jgi:hypothetical protein
MNSTRLIISTLNEIRFTNLPKIIQSHSRSVSKSICFKSKVQEMDYVQKNPYFDKYKDKLKTVYKYSLWFPNIFTIFSQVYLIVYPNSNDPDAFEKVVKNLDGFQSVKTQLENTESSKKTNYSYTKKKVSVLMDDVFTLAPNDSMNLSYSRN